MNSKVSPLGVLVIALFVTFIVLIYVLSRKRTRALSDFAQSIGFVFEGETWNDPVSTPHLQTALFGAGKNKHTFQNIMSGTFAGIRTSLFDHKLDNPDDNDYPLTVVAFSLDVPLPSFEVICNDLVARFLGWGKCIKFDSSPEFSSNCLVLARPEEEAQVRALFTPTLLAYLGNLPHQEIWNIQGSGPTLVVHRRGIVLARNIRPFLERASEIARAFLDSGGLKRA